MPFFAMEGSSVWLSLKPAWMKDSGSILGGNFLSQYNQQCMYFYIRRLRTTCSWELFPPRSDANYLLKAVQGFQSHGIPIYAIGFQVWKISYYRCGLMKLIGPRRMNPRIATLLILLVWLPLHKRLNLVWPWGHSWIITGFQAQILSGLTTTGMVQQHMLFNWSVLTWITISLRADIDGCYL